ncbi:YfgM family protein [Marinicella gelatinilytica]|uniref:YfgM family protein n=1 Tax=Marinicella gelatinilytica TaxID=2996017 RepID=UPI00226098B4|nr:tetratricopeptide repeat protein [Marinicella gelatinilytica]MCX7544688.1 tetratricopeptide repeat protein [Marinicella gelatinilytica]
MALEEYDDYEQEQIIKDWLRQNWFTIFAGIALGIGGLWGYAKWQNTQAEQNQAAAMEYQQLVSVLETKSPSEAADALAQYDEKYSANYYAMKAHMTLADRWLAEDQVDQAIKEYQFVLDAKAGKPIAEMVRLRLARLYVANENYDAAREQLAMVQSGAYKTVVEEIKGDIFVAENTPDKAQDSYQLALLSGEGYSGKALLEMKLADIKVSE